MQNYREVSLAIISLRAPINLKLFLIFFRPYILPVQVNKDNRGGINVAELKAALHMAGFDYDMERTEDLMSEYDIDHSGLIELNEFKALFDSLLTDVGVRIRNLSGQLIMTIDEGDMGKTAGNDDSEKTVKRREVSKQFDRYVPPDKGVLSFRLMDGMATKKLYRVITSQDLQLMLAVAAESGHATAMLEHAIENTKVS